MDELELELLEKSLLESYKKAHKDAVQYGMGFMIVVKNQTAITHLPYHDVMNLKKEEKKKKKLQS